MIDRMLAMLLDTSLWLFGVLTLALLYAVHEAGFRIGLWRGRQRPVHDRDLAGIGTITTGMLGLLAFTLGLTINIAQARSRRGAASWSRRPMPSNRMAALQVDRRR